ncbi:MULTISPECIES: HAMP domain-containing sensor histidine kinase [unclassified Staphylococcus]|uniref:two-component system histidine kinase PnpS n=1 Tax=unclassified Staphylococcus TaxID=91994 RepID=UPI0021CF89FF|nr:MULTISPECIES: HAMP domain-containing sensor histidine kinase [unclassified Staphylococcus]UXR77443.1 ATP-binding protein [Staphylococcus sp. IVB6227]UXR81706.1 ATP-binding protein [Staphylococcus sp. IVB6214]
MIKFYHKLLLLLTTLIVVSFLILGFFVHNSIYTNTMDDQQMRARQSAQLLLAAYREKNEIHAEQLAKQMHVNALLIEDDQVKRSHSQTYPSLDKEKSILLEKLERQSTIYEWNKKSGIYTYGQKENNQILLIRGHSDIVTELQMTFWKYLIFIGMLTLGFIYFIVRYIHRTYIKPINEVSYAASLLSEGNYHIRIPESNVKETKELYHAINVLARRLEKLNHAQKMQRNRLLTTLENIPSAILMIDKKGEVVVANKTYIDMFHNGENVEQRHYEDVLDSNLKKLIVEGFKVEKGIYQQIELHLNDIHQKFFDAACVPILTRKKKRLQGMVIVLHDITALKKLENLRKDFVANVSHELRTPITSIKGFAETLIDGAKNDSDSLEMFLDIILKESNRIQSLVEDLLNLSKIEQNPTLEKHRIDLSQVARDGLSMIQPIADAKQITLVDKIAPHIYAMADEDKLTQVIVNLMTNAVNYSPKNKRVTLRVYNETQQHVIEVIDEGIGIHQNEKYRIFERFYRVDKARSRDSGGTGLGLSITKHIVEAYQGKIEVESEEGNGSMFRVVLPNQVKGK